jgi:hypothetical protein
VRRFSWVDAAEDPPPVTAPVWAVLEPVDRRRHRWTRRHVELVVRNFVGGLSELYFDGVQRQCDTAYFYYNGELVDKYIVTHWRPLIAPELPQKKKQPAKAKRKVKKR